MSVFTNPAHAAPTSATAYVQAVLEALGDREAVGVLRDTPRTLRAAIGEVPPMTLLRPEAAGKWSVGQVIAHLADSELVWAWRMRRVLSEDRPALGGYDQDAWARQLHYTDVQPSESLDAFESARSWNLALLSRIPASEQERVGVHTERGEESLRFMIRLYAGHDLVHLAQVERILAGGEGPAAA